MRNNDARVLIREIHKNKNFRATAFEKKFLEDLSFYLQMDNITISEKQSKILQEIYRKSQGG